MPHRLAVAGLPKLGAPVVVRPRLAQQEGVVVTDVARAGDGLVFRASGAVPAGIYREDDGADAVRVLADDGGVWLEPRAVSDLVIASFVATAGAPSSVSAIGFARGDGRPILVPGQSVGLSGDGAVAVVLDAGARRVRRVELGTLATTEVAELGGGVDPQMVGPVALDVHGSEALFADSDDGHVWLAGLSLADGTRTPLTDRLPAPARVLGAFVPKERGVLALHVRLGDEPHARLLVLTPSGAREIFHAPVAQPAALPAFLDDEHALVLLSPKPHPLASYGPIDLYALPLAGGSQQALTRTGDLRGRVRVTGDRVLVEGGQALLELARG